MIPYFLWDKIHIGGLALNVWGILVGLGFVIGLLWNLRQAKKKKMDGDHLLNLSIIIFFCAFVGARIFFVLLYFRDFLAEPIEMLKIWNGGLVIYGGIIGAVIGAVIYMRIKKLNFWKWADLTVPGLALGIFIGRMGCFSIHDHIGKVTNVPWGIEWTDGLVRHETSIYASLFGLLIFIVLLLAERYWKVVKKTGVLTSLFIVLYSLGRFVVDIFRATDIANPDPRWLGLTVSQYLSIILLIIGLFLIYIFAKRKILRSSSN